MTEKIPLPIQGKNLERPLYTDVSRDLFPLYKERYAKEKEVIKAETREFLSDLTAKIRGIFTTPKPLEAPPEPKYDELRLSLIAQDYLDKNHSEIKQENPDTSCMIIYLPGRNGVASQAKKICIPRSNPENKVLRVAGFSLTPVPKSNGYNTEYIIKDVQGNNWTQLAILFPAENPKFTRKTTLEKDHRNGEAGVQGLIRELANLPKTSKNQAKRESIQSKIIQERNRIGKLRRAIDEIGNPVHYVHFSYIPYREGLNTPENQKKGFDYLSEAMKKTYEHKVGNISIGKMRSNVQGMTIGEELPWQYPFILNLVERMDFEVYFDKTGKVLKSKKDIDALMESQLGRSLTTFGTNTSNSFNWQRNEKTHAQGVGQIIPSTYKLYEKSNRYGVLFPEEDFDIATRDHETSFRLQISHFDDQAYQFPKFIKDNWKSLMKDPQMNIGLLAILSAGYNGYMMRIINEVFPVYPKNYEECRRMLSLGNIAEKMKQAMDGDLVLIQATKPRKGVDMKNFEKEKKEKVAKRIAMYKESMTYVLKAEYVWKYLKERYKGKF